MMTGSTHRTRKVLAIAVRALVSVAAIIGLSHASAQDLRLEEVLVTATKRTESLQDVPAAITAFSGEKIVSAGLQNMTDVARYIPNVSISQTSGGASPARIYVRGVGSGNLSSFEQSVGMFIDGVYSGRSYQQVAPFLDVAMVEVLKGPQGVLFGKSTVAGALIINSARPTDAPEGELRAQYEMEYGSTEYVGMVSGPLSDRLAGRLAGQYRDTEGFMDNLIRGDEEPESESTAVRGSLEFAATDTVVLYGKLDYTERDATGSTNQLTGIDGNFSGVIEHRDLLSPLEDAKFDDKNTLNSWDEESSDIDSWNAAFQVDWDMGDLALTSVTGYSEYDVDLIQDSDFSELFFIQTNSQEEFEQYSQEIRLSSPGGETLDYIVGIYLESSSGKGETAADISLLELGPPIPAVQFAPAGNFEQDAKTAAVFGQLIWRFREDWALTGGLRYSYEEKDAELETYTADFGTNTPTNNPLLTALNASLLDRVDSSLDEDRDTDHWSPTVNLTWDYSDAGMAYLRGSRGYKSGGFNSQLTDGDPDRFEFDDEKVESVELGAKMTLLDGAATLNLAAFYTEFSDRQVSYFDDNGFIVENAAESTSKGVEADARWLATQYLSFSLSLAYLSSEYDEYFPPCTAAQENAEDPEAAGCDLETGRYDASGETAGRAPDWSGTFIVNFSYPVGSALEFRANVDVLYEDTVSDAVPELAQDSYHKINARLALASTADTWELALIGKNLNDETTANTGAGAPFFTGSYFQNRNAPRTVAFEARYRF